VLASAELCEKEMIFPIPETRKIRATKKREIGCRNSLTINLGCKA
jgi:hypothetical protein